LISGFGAATSEPMKPTIDPIRPTQSVVAWLIENREGVVVGAMVAVAIVALMLIAKLVGQRMIERETEAQHLGWRSVVGRVLAKTSIFFMVMAAIDIVATYAQPPARDQHLGDVGFTIACALQGAIWA